MTTAGPRALEDVFEGMVSDDAGNAKAQRMVSCSLGSVRARIDRREERVRGLERVEYKELALHRYLSRRQLRPNGATTLSRWSKGAILSPNTPANTWDDSDSLF